jgi:phosphodiesterase/alkaline phosphatase D-like protein
MKIAAASCTKLADDPDQTVWTLIRREQPDVLLLMGDNVYLRSNRHTDPVRLEHGLGNRYAEQLAQKRFAALLKDMKARGKPVLAIYDDHDFLGDNRTGTDNPLELRRAARRALVEAFDPPTTDGQVYSVSRLGLVDVVVLDTRFHRAPPGSTSVNAVLGAKQWTWLEATLAAATPAKYTVVVSSTTFHRFGDESWELYPKAAARLRTLLAGRRGALVIAGDIHRNYAYDDDGVVEIITSGAARKGVTYGAPRRNYAILDFTPASVHVQLHSLKVNGRFDFTIPRARWALP